MALNKSKLDNEGGEDIKRLRRIKRFHELQQCWSNFSGVRITWKGADSELFSRSGLKTKIYFQQQS